MEAEAEGRVSINKLSKRKTDGVYSDFLIRGRKNPVVALRHRKMTWHLGG